MLARGRAVALKAPNSIRHDAKDLFARRAPARVFIRLAQVFTGVRGQVQRLPPPLAIGDEEAAAWRCAVGLAPVGSRKGDPRAIGRPTEALAVAEGHAACDRSRFGAVQRNNHQVADELQTSRLRVDEHRDGDSRAVGRHAAATDDAPVLGEPADLYSSWTSTTPKSQP